MVARVQLHNMCQDRDEMIRRLVLAYEVKSASVNSSSNILAAIDVNYTENIVCDVVTCRLADNKIQLDLLGKKKTKT